MKDNENFVTIFDSNFLPQGIALYSSLEKTLTKFTLWVICIDAECNKILNSLNKPHIKTIELSTVETPELLRVKKERSRAEYCWTLSPFAPKFVFDHDANVTRVTYVDADTFFLRNPYAIYKEFEDAKKPILISEHAYAPEYDQSALSGKYCIQFMIFQRNESEKVRKWWEIQCIKWCFNRFEDGKFGDQKYLDDWLELFPDDVHVLNDKELLLAPWNASRFPYTNAVMYHFHGVRLLKNNRVNIGNYLLPRVLVENVYKKYIEHINNAIETLIKVGYKYKPQQKSSFSQFFKSGISVLHNNIKL